jgi:hypothetical protein
MHARGNTDSSSHEMSMCSQPEDAELKKNLYESMKNSGVLNQLKS